MRTGSRFICSPSGFSLTAGPLRLLDGDFPGREFMKQIAEYNLNQALALA
jgi:hypothetical protein